MVSSLTQSVYAGSGTSAMAMAYALDPASRVKSATTTVNGSETNRLRYRYADGTDAPSSIDSSTDGGVTWTTTRYIKVPDIGLVSSRAGTTTTLQFMNLHGDLVASMPDTAGGTIQSAYAETDEFGQPIDASSNRYTWLGNWQRSRDALGGQMLMGARLYNPQTGAFSSPDPEAGGNVTAYTYPQNPVNEADTSGRYNYSGWTAWKWAYTDRTDWKAMFYSSVYSMYIMNKVQHWFRYRSRYSEYSWTYLGIESEEKRVYYQKTMVCYGRRKRIWHVPAGVCYKDPWEYLSTEHYKYYTPKDDF